MNDIPEPLKKFFKGDLTPGQQRDIAEHHQAVKRIWQSGMNFPKGGWSPALPGMKKELGDEPDAT